MVRIFRLLLVLLYRMVHEKVARRLHLHLATVVPTGHEGPEGSRRVKAPSFRDNGTVMVVGLSALRCQPYAPAAFTPRSIPDDRKHTWYSFLLEAESTPGS